MRSLAAGLLIALAAPGCSRDPEGSVDGEYTMCSDVAGYSGETLKLQNGRFQYWFYSDVVGGDEPQYPLSGTYRVKRDQLILDLPKIHRPVRTIDRVNGVPVLWREDGLKLWKAEGRIHPYAVLIRVHREWDNDYRPRLEALYTAEMRAREEREYEERYRDQPLPVRGLLRASTLRNDPDLAEYLAEIRSARTRLTPELVGGLVRLMGHESRENVQAQTILERLYLKTWPIEEEPPFAKSDAERKKALSVLIDAFAAAPERSALESVVMIFLRASGTPSIDLAVPDAGVRVRLEPLPNGGGQYASEGPDPAWKSVLTKVVAACQAWARERIGR